MTWDASKRVSPVSLLACPFAAAPLGVGITYTPQVEPLLRQRPGLFDVMEIEPQTLWLESGDPAAPFLLPEAILEHVAALPGHKLLHSVAAPVGGAVRPHPAQFPLLRRMIERLDVPYFSDHLSFNFTPEFHTGFFLPPRQTAQGVAMVADAIRALRTEVGVPVAVETGVSYLRPLPDEMEDGAFHAAVIEAADCGLLLDLHNLYANERNGRQRIEDFLEQIPLDRVWEVHLAGGMEMDGFYLDAHSGAIPDALLAALPPILPLLPNLKAINFEIFPSFVEVVGLDLVARQMERMRDLWKTRATAPVPVERPATIPRSATPAAPSEGLLEAGSPGAGSPAEWENALGSLVIGRNDDSPIGQALRDDPGVHLVRGLIHEFRASMVVGVLRLSSRLLMLALGPDVFRLLLTDFWAQTPPHQFAATEAEAFAEYLIGQKIGVPHLAKILEFERAIVHTLTDQTSRVVTFDSDPLPLLRALSAGRLPNIIGQPGLFEIEVTPDGPVSATGLDRDALRQAFPYH